MHGNFVVMTVLASGLAAGSLGALNYGWSVMMAPMGVFGMALAPALPGDASTFTMVLSILVSIKGFFATTVTSFICLADWRSERSGTVTSAELISKAAEPVLV